jgi:hypothetical protein
MLPDVFALLDVAAIRAFLGEPPRIYRHGVAAVQSPEAPYVTWAMVSGTPENHLSGTPPVDRFQIQVDWWSQNDGSGSRQMNALGQAIRDQIETAHQIESFDADLRDAETMRYRGSLTFTWWLHRT